MTGQENKTNLPYLWNSLHFCHWAGFASIVTAVVSSVYLFTISLLCSWHTTEFRDNLFFPAWLIAVGRGKARKSSEKNTLKENGREGNGYISATLHPPSLPNTPVSHKTSFIVPFCISLQLKVFFSLGSILKSVWKEVCDSVSSSLFSIICFFFSLQQPYYPVHPTSLFWFDIFTATSLFQPDALWPRGLCLLQDSAGYGSCCSSSPQKEGWHAAFFFSLSHLHVS